MHLQPEEAVLAPVRAPAVAADPVLSSIETKNKISFPQNNTKKHCLFCLKVLRCT